MPILTRFTNSWNHDFREAAATAFLGISKIPTVNFEIHSSSFHLFKKFCFQVTEIHVEFRVQTERFFGCGQYNHPLGIYLFAGR